MKVFITCRSWCYGYEDHGWEIKGAFSTEEKAQEFLEESCKWGSMENKEDWYVEPLEVL